MYWAGAFEAALAGRLAEIVQPNVMNIADGTKQGIRPGNDRRGLVPKSPPIPVVASGGTPGSPEHIWKVLQ